MGNRHKKTYNQSTEATRQELISLNGYFISLTLSFSKRFFIRNIRIEIKEVFWPIVVEIKLGTWLNSLIHTIDEKEDLNLIPLAQNSI